MPYGSWDAYMEGVPAGMGAAPAGLGSPASPAGRGAAGTADPPVAPPAAAGDGPDTAATGPVAVAVGGEGGRRKGNSREQSGYGDGRTRSRSTDDKDAQGAGHAGRPDEPLTGWGSRGKRSFSGVSGAVCSEGRKRRKVDEAETPACEDPPTPNSERNGSAAEAHAAAILHSPNAKESSKQAQGQSESPLVPNRGSGSDVAPWSAATDTEADVGDVRV